MSEREFLRNERPNEYELRFSVEGQVRLTVKAESLEDAMAQARAMVDEDDFGLELDDVFHVKVDRVRKSCAMYLVTRDGRPMQVSVLEEHDKPRQPDESGF
ncbi:hypothetical protein [Rhizobium leguminosarum]|uniref:Uncharacterized protein n=1 Tax=Rhizobium leguminosarum TaxID=384 RepID=A0A7K3VEX3_RHILE|nr:hypothetical protein [Rhizobium leguminosarum]NEK15713.1 hypothetical protein [Rhizobium leguminosarum]